MKINLVFVPFYLTLIFISTLSYTNSLQIARLVEYIPLDGASGPESLAFNSVGNDFRTSVADGRVIKLEKRGSNWTVSDFAVTSRNRTNCIPYSVSREEQCGRPLGLGTDEETGELYIADAYLGLFKVGPNGGLATPLVSEADGQKFVFTNGLDMDQLHRVVFFTDSSTTFQRRQFMQITPLDKTGRLIKYDITTKKTQVLLGNLSFANGVAVSKDSTFVLVVEASLNRILKYHLVGPKAGKFDVFAVLLGTPDNIRRNSKGEFWVATNVVNLKGTAVKLSEEGKILKVYADVKMEWSPISEVIERDGKLWMGSVQRFNVTVHELY